MASVSDQLDRLYHLTLQSGSDPEFYQSVYEYCHLVLTNPTLSSIFRKNELEYAQKHGDIWDDKTKSSDQKSSETMRLERFSMIADFASLQMRIYYPIDDYKSSSGPEYEQDPGALLMLRGIKNVPTTKYSKASLKEHNKWFDGKRPMYEKDLRQFHLKMLAALEEKPALPITLEETGDFRIGNVKGNLNPKSQEYTILKLLFDAQGDIVPYLSLVQAIRPQAEQATKGYRDDLAKIINSLKQKLSEERNRIKNARGLGYRLILETRE